MVPLLLDTSVIVISKAVQVRERLPLVLESVTANSCVTRYEIQTGPSDLYDWCCLAPVTGCSVVCVECVLFCLS